MKPIENAENKPQQPIKEKGARAGYILTLAELEQIEAAEDVLSDYVAEAILAADKGVEALQDEAVRRGAKEALKAAGLNPERVYTIAGKTLARKWWTTRNADHDGKITIDEESGRIVKYLVTSEGRDEAIYPNPTFYAAETVTARRRALGLSQAYKYIDSGLFPVLSFLRAVLAPEKYQGAELLDVPSDVVTNALATIGRKAITEKTVAASNRGGGVVVIKNDNRGTEIVYSQRLETESKIDLTSPSAAMLLDLVNANMYSSNFAGDTVIIKPKVYREFRGLKSAAAAKAIQEKDTDTLGGITVSFTDDKGGKGKYPLFKLSYSQPNKGSVFVYNEIYLEYLKRLYLQENRQPMQMPKEFYQFRGDSPTFFIARRLSEHHRTNAGNSNSHTISVKTLLECSSIIPFDELPDKWQASQRIIEPFIRALDEISATGKLEWEFAYASRSRKKGALSDNDLELVYKNYAVFSSMMIKFTFTDDPGYKGLIANKSKTRAAAKTNAAKKSRSKSK